MIDDCFTISVHSHKHSILSPLAITLRVYILPDEEQSEMIMI